MKPVTHLVAGLYRRDFIEWCRENGRDPHDRDVLYVSSPNVLRGLSAPVELHITERGHDRSDLAEIWAHVHVINRAVV